MEKALIKELQRITKTNYTSLEILYFEFIGSRYRLEKISKDAEYLNKIEDAGTEIVQVDVSEWQDACSSVYDKYGEKYADIISEIKNTSY